MNLGNHKYIIRRLTGVFIFASAVVLFGSSVKGQELKRIEFKKGASSSTVRGTTGQNGATYAVRARSGQLLEITLSPRSGVGIKVESNGRFGHMVLLREERGGTFKVGLEESGEYTIFVGSKNGSPVGFSLTVRITRMTDI